MWHFWNVVLRKDAASEVLHIKPLIVSFDTVIARRLFAEAIFLSTAPLHAWDCFADEAGSQ